MHAARWRAACRAGAPASASPPAPRCECDTQLTRTACRALQGAAAAVQGRAARRCGARRLPRLPARQRRGARVRQGRRQGGRQRCRCAHVCTRRSALPGLMCVPAPLAQAPSRGARTRATRARRPPRPRRRSTCSGSRGAQQRRRHASRSRCLCVALTLQRLAPQQVRRRAGRAAPRAGQAAHRARQPRCAAAHASPRTRLQR